jgi:hypothetical protein
MLLAVLNIDPELCLSAESGVDDEAAHDWLGVCAQVELLVDGDGMVEGILNKRNIKYREVDY